MVLSPWSSVLTLLFKGPVFPFPPMPRVAAGAADGAEAPGALRAGLAHRLA